MSSDPQSVDSRRRSTVHPDFDGHLEKPLSAMTTEERLAWAWQGALLLHLGRTLRQESQEDGSTDSPLPPAQD
ncbi:MAG: hypothetical protein ACR2GY_13870 [Phycisphaerales bacterium]